MGQGTRAPGTIEVAPIGATARSGRAAAGRGGWDRAYAWRLVSVDVLAIAVAVLFAISIDLVSLREAVRSGGDVAVDRAVTDLLLVLAWPAVLGASQAYDRRLLGLGSDEYRVVVLAAARILSLVALIVFVFDLPIEADYVLTVVGLGVALSLIGRRLARRRLHRRRSDGRDIHRVLAVGSAASVSALADGLSTVQYSGLRIVGAVVPGGPEGGVSLTGEVPIVGGPEDIARAVAVVDAEAIAIADSSTLDGPAIRRLAWSLERTGIDLLVVPTITDVMGPRVVVRPVGTIPLLYVDEPELTGPNRVAKGLFDRLAALGVLVLVGPLLLVAAALVRLTSPGPAFYRQDRVGLSGRPFRIAKLRTMVVDADAQRAELVAAHGGGELFKMRDDPRVTPFGRFLRRWSIDELPQLWNVLRGDMSLVGPRPGLPDEVAGYEEEVTRRLLVRPGITGLWQVSGRSDLPWEETVRLDLYYVDNWSLALDVQILFRTVAAVLRRHGAY